MLRNICSSGFPNFGLNPQQVRNFLFADLAGHYIANTAQQALHLAYSHEARAEEAASQSFIARATITMQIHQALIITMQIHQALHRHHHSDHAALQEHGSPKQLHKNLGQFQQELASLSDDALAFCQSTA